jgi:hypothetical protein
MEGGTGFERLEARLDSLANAIGPDANGALPADLLSLIDAFDEITDAECEPDNDLEDEPDAEFEFLDVFEFMHFGARRALPLRATP